MLEGLREERFGAQSAPLALSPKGGSFFCRLAALLIALILQQAGYLLPTEHIKSHDPEYGPTCDKAEEEYHYMLKLLNENDQKHFKHLLDLNLNISCMESCASFTCGFHYGALLMLEIMNSQDSLCACP